MNTKLYDQMDWPGIEGVVYAEHDNPHNVLGATVVKNEVLIRAFFPDAIGVSVVLDGKKKKYSMDLADESGYFAVLIPGKKIPSYHYEVSYETGTVEALEAYNTNQVITKKDIDRFENGIHYEIYEKLGAHVVEIDGQKGVLFAVWAPNAVSVSVVGDFNLWDGRRNLMRRLGDSGIFELFIPTLETGEIYKYEIHQKGGNVVLKTDPYGSYSERRPNTASVVWDSNSYEWQDDKWLAKRKKKNDKKEPMLVYEVHLGSWMRHPDSADETQAYYSYRELADKLVKYVKEMDLADLVTTIKKITEYKFQIKDSLDIIMVWYRDVLLLKATNDANHLIFKEEIQYIRKVAVNSSYEGLETIIRAIETAKSRLDANVNFDLTMELMFLVIKEN